MCRELLEVVLAAVALEIPVAVVFSGPGIGRLQAPFAASWRQLTDFRMAPVYCYRADRDARGDAPELAVDMLDEPAYRALTGSVRAELML